MAKSKLERHLTEYYAYHQDFRNRATHFIGVPLVAYALFHLLAWFRFVGAESWLSFGGVFFAGSMIHYLKVNAKLAPLVGLLFAPVWLAAEHYAQVTDGTSVWIFTGTLVLGVVLQGLGHVFEGRRPALVDNVFQIFNAPLLITCEILFLLGWRKDLERACRLHQGAGNV